MAKEVHYSKIFTFLQNYSKVNGITYSTETTEKIKTIFEKATKNKSYFLNLKLKDNVYTFSYYGRKNRYLTCPETKYNFYPDFYSITKEDVSGCKKDTKYYLYK